MDIQRGIDSRPRRRRWGNGDCAALAPAADHLFHGVALLGIDSAQTPIGDRIETWHRIAGDLRPRHAEAREIGLDDLDAALTSILAGENRGKRMVRV